MMYMVKMRWRAACRLGPEVSISGHICIKLTWPLTRFVSPIHETLTEEITITGVSARMIYSLSTYYDYIQIG